MPGERLTAWEWLLKQALSIRACGRLVAWAMVSGLIAKSLGQRLSGSQRLESGLVLILPGIGGEDFLNHNIAHGLNDAQVLDAIEIFDWTRGRFLMLYNLMGHGRNVRQAALLAERIRHYQRHHPNRPIHLIAHSGGTGIAVMALEQLGAGEKITAALLLASALSPEYNLARALRHTEYGIYNFHSPYDVFHLGIGTTTFGTIDRKRCRAAGKVGFRQPEGLRDADAALYAAKLRQVVWRKQWLRSWHAGGHTGWADRRFCRDWLSPIILRHHQGQPTDLQREQWF